jgi:hypothetical protein
MDNTSTQPLDPQAVALAQSIRQVESGGNFNAKGASGEYGAYQYLPATWASRAKQYGITTPLDQATPEQQNEVTYKWIEDKKNQGYNVGQIASMHNAGDGSPNAYLGHSGVNSSGVAYDTKNYAQKVANAYQQIKSQNGSGTQNNSGTQGIQNNQTQDNQTQNGVGYQTQPSFSKTTTATDTNTDTSQGDSLGSELSNRLSNAGKALTQSATGEINPLSGVLQTVGQGAGAVGDVLNSGLNFLTGGLLKKGEKKLGEVVGNSSIGKSVGQGVNNFTQAHPELSGDIGAVGNIVSAIPMFKGLGLAKDALGNIGKDALASTLADVAPEVSSKAMASGIAKRGTVKSFLTGEIKQATDPAVRDVAETVNKYVPNFNKMGTFSEKVNATRQALSDTAESLKNDVISSGKDRIYSFKELASKLNSIKLAPDIVGNVKKTYQNVLNEAMSIAKENGGKISNLLDARKQFDEYISNRLPNLYNSDALTPMRVSVKQIRNGMNDFIEKGLPDIGFRQRLLDQSKLFDAIDNMSTKAGKEVGSTRFSRFVQRNPKKIGLLKKTATVGATAAGGAGLIKGYDMLTGK